MRGNNRVGHPENRDRTGLGEREAQELGMEQDLNLEDWEAQQCLAMIG